ncbi:MAG: uracil-xanthine permease family protein [Clostridia bacterium]
MSKKQKPSDAIYDASTLGKPKMITLGVQHLFAMFGATILVPAITGLSVSATLLFAGLGTILFHLVTKLQVPAFLGSSFAFLSAYGLVTATGEDIPLQYSCLGVAIAGLMYLILSALVKVWGPQKVMKFFPPIVTGPVIIAIGLILSPSAFNNITANGFVAFVAVAVVIGFNIWGKGMAKIIPILLGVVISYVLSMIIDPSTREVFVANWSNAAWFGVPFLWENTAFSVFGADFNSSMAISAIITILPITLATMMEHIGDICAIGSTVGKNYIEKPGLHRTLLGDGLATTLASLFGAPANTTYGENTGVLALSKVYDPKVIRLAAVFSVVLSFSPKFAAIISSMPTATIGGVSLVLYGMIASVGVRNIVENQVDFTKSRNVIIAALILVLAIGINFSTVGAITFTLGDINISLSGLAIASLVGIILNAILPGNDYKFGSSEEGDTAVNFEV